MPEDPSLSLPSAWLASESRIAGGKCTLIHAQSPIKQSKLKVTGDTQGVPSTFACSTEPETGGTVYFCCWLHLVQLKAENGV